jgi:hypothetical protein
LPGLEATRGKRAGQRRASGLSVASNRAGPRAVDLVPNYATRVLEVRSGEFATVGYARETEQAMYEAEQKRLLYVATTRARDHLVPSLFCGKDDSHAVRIRQFRDERPDLSTEVVLAAGGVADPPPRDPRSPVSGRVGERGSGARFR